MIVSIRPSPEAPTQRFSQRFVEPLTGVISPVPPRDASVRPKKCGIGLFMAWGTLDSIFMVFGENVILDLIVLVATERGGLTRF